MPDPLTLVCQVCRWHPPGDMEMSIVEAHFDVEPDHDPTDIRLEMVAWCARCGLEMTLGETRHPRPGVRRHRHTCPGCGRTEWVTQKNDKTGPN